MDPGKIACLCLLGGLVIPNVKFGEHKTSTKLRSFTIIPGQPVLVKAGKV
jgi:hypothetical protein